MFSGGEPRRGRGRGGRGGPQTSSRRKIQMVDPEDQETKVDDDQEDACASTIDLLLAAGYFRARVATLSRFDKIVGGLTWCISSANVDIDVNLRFTENMPIGQKIKLGENIVKALQKMECQYPLQSHQIKGEDWVKIFPVVQWLVKKVLEVREETGDLLRMYSEDQFNRNYKLPSDAEFLKTRPKAEEYVESLGVRYRPARQFRHAAQEKDSMDPERRIHAALLEYGRVYKGSEATIEESKHRPDEGGDKYGKLAHLVEQKQAERKEAVRSELKMQEEEIAQMMSSMASVGGATGSVSRSAFSSVMGMGSSEISQLSAEYSEKSRNLGMTEEQMEKKFAEESHKRVTTALQKQIQLLATRVAETKEYRDSLAETAKESQAVLAKRLRYNERVLAETEKFAALETPENAEDIAKLRSLVALNEALKGQETDFKANCKAQLAELTEMIKTRQGEIGAGLKEQLDELESVYEKERSRLQQIRKAYAVKSREVASVRRKINDIPSRTQLVQYEKRFVDVFEQVALKLQETRKYYSMFNTLSDQADILNNEIELLNMIYDHFKTGTKKRQKQSLAEALAKTADDVESSVAKSKSKLEDERKERAKMGEMYQQGVEKSREYYKLVKKFQDECRLNEELLVQLGE